MTDEKEIVLTSAAAIIAVIYINCSLVLPVIYSVHYSDSQHHGIQTFIAIAVLRTINFPLTLILYYIAKEFNKFNSSGVCPTNTFIHVSLTSFVIHNFHLSGLCLNTGIINICKLFDKKVELDFNAKVAMKSNLTLSKSTKRRVCMSTTCTESSFSA